MILEDDFIAILKKILQIEYCQHTLNTKSRSDLKKWHIKIRQCLKSIVDAEENFEWMSNTLRARFVDAILHHSNSPNDPACKEVFNCAVINSSAPVVRVFLEHGFDPRVSLKEGGIAPESRAMIRGDESIIRVFEEFGVSRDDMMHSITGLLDTLGQGFCLMTNLLIAPGLGRVPTIPINLDMSNNVSLIWNIVSYYIENLLL